MNATTARARAVATDSRQIDESQQRAIAAREAQSRPRNALEAMASRLEVTAGSLKTTLLNTVFAGCRNDSEFVALVIVSNTYGLNPLLKEIYAFPAKGGGITPMVSVDGWIKLMHSHPAFDSIEFEDIADEKGGIYAIEATIHRTDKSRPTKIIEYLEECRGNTGPWQKAPLRMLRHRALIQCARVAFGFSGLSAPEDTTIEGVVVTNDTPVLPSRQSLAEELDDEIPAFAGGQRDHDAATGEVYPTDSRGMTEVDEETARQLDAGNDGTLADDNPTAAEGPADEQRGEPQAEDDSDQPTWVAKLAGLREKLSRATTLAAINGIDRDWTNLVRPAVDDENSVRAFEADIAAKKKAIKPAAGV